MRTTQLAVVGGGPAGLAAAIAAATAGARTMLLDEQSTLGGQLRYRISPLATPDGDQRRRPAELADELIQAATVAGVDLHPGALAWGLFEGNILGVVEGDSSYELQADQIVIAAGSTDLPFPFAGGSLPGVMTARAVQILVNQHRVLPGERFVVIGDGPPAGEIAGTIELAGAYVVATVDPRAGNGAFVARGFSGVQSVEAAGRRYDADVVVVALGRQPDPALALMAGCAAGYSPAFGGFVPVRDDRLRTSVPGILVAGDAAGVCDVIVALAEGRLAGMSAAAAEGLVADGRLNDARTDYERAAPERGAIARALQPTYTQG